MPAAPPSLEFLHPIISHGRGLALSRNLRRARAVDFPRFTGDHLLHPFAGSDRSFQITLNIFRTLLKGVHHVRASYSGWLRLIALYEISSKPRHLKYHYVNGTVTIQDNLVRQSLQPCFSVGERLCWKYRLYQVYPARAHFQDGSHWVQSNERWPSNLILEVKKVDKV